jgi:hypothetical protein
MAKIVRVQVRGVASFVQIRADEVVEEGTVGTNGHKVKIMAGGKQIGSFNGNVVDGWWVLED